MLVTTAFLFLLVRLTHFSSKLEAPFVIVCFNPNYNPVLRLPVFSAYFLQLYATHCKLKEFIWMLKYRSISTLSQSVIFLEPDCFFDINIWDETDLADQIELHMQICKQYFMHVQCCWCPDFRETYSCLLSGFLQRNFSSDYLLLFSYLHSSRNREYSIVSSM